MNKLTWTMEIAEPGSMPQILIIISLMAAGVLLGVLLARSGIETRKVLLVFGIVLMVSEVLKEAFLYHIFGGYSWSDFPFQLCSIPMYFCVLYYFFQKRWMAQFVMVYALIGGVAALVVPSATFSYYVLLTVHSLFWHTVLLLLGVFIAARQTKEDLRILHFIPVGITYLVLAGIAVAFNTIFYGISKGTMNMFFLGPGWPDMFILNDIHTNSGWIAATWGMIGVSEGVGFAVYLVLFLGFTLYGKASKPSAP